MKKRLLFNDFLLISVIIVCMIIFSFTVYYPTYSLTITVVYDNEFYKNYRLDIDVTEQIADSGVVLEIKNGNAYIIHSDCPDKTCMQNKPITINSAGGANIICLPNKVVISKDASYTNKEADVIAG